MTQHSIGLAVGFLLFTGSLTFANGNVWAQTYDDLVRQARDGKAQPALEFLRAQSMDSPDRDRYIPDWMDLALAAGQDNEVVAVYTRYGSSVILPARSLVTAARAYRNLQQWPSSLALYDEALRREAQQLDWQRGRILVLADSGQDAIALAAARQLVEKDKKDVSNLLTLAYVHQRASRPWDALEEVSRTREIAPGNPEVLNWTLDLLVELKMPTEALALAQANPNVVTPARLRFIQAAKGAELVRLSFAPTRSESERDVIPNKAMVFYAPLLEQWQNIPDARADLNLIRIDRMGAQLMLRQYTTVVNEYESLKAQGIEVPPYAQRWAASAYMSIRKPFTAMEMYQALNAQSVGDPDVHPDDTSSLIYAMVESERMDEAVALADQAARTYPPTRRLEGDQTLLPNEVLMDARQQAALIHSFADDLPEAQARMEEMLALAPGNTSLQSELAGVYRSRAQPRRAEELLKRAETMSPRSLGLEVQQGYTARTLHEWRQMEVLADDVIERYPDSTQAIKLDRARQLHHMYELRVTTSRGLSAQNPVLGNSDFDFDTVLYTPAINHDWRVFMGAGYARGAFPEGPGQQQTQRLGLEWRVRDNTAEAEITSHHFHYGSRVGFRLSFEHAFSDHWSAGANAERLSRDTPLRALRSDITANSGQVFLRWTGNERRQWTLQANTLDYSDGNRRTGLGLSGRERLYTRPHWNLDALIALETSHNSKPGGPYFAPRSDVFFLPVLSLNHIISRHYERVWSQNIQVGYGAYQQKDYGTGAVASISYGLRYTHNDAFDVGMSYGVIRRPYDGVQERAQRLSFDMTYRF